MQNTPTWQLRKFIVTYGKELVKASLTTVLIVQMIAVERDWMAQAYITKPIVNEQKPLLPADRQFSA